MKAPHIREEISAFHKEQIVVDLHVDVIIQQRLFGYDISKFHKPWMRRQPFINQADVPRMLEGGYTGAALGLHYFPWESKRAWKEVRKQLDYMEQVIERDPRVMLAESAADIREAKAKGKLAFLGGIEGAHILNGSLAPLEEARRRGCVYLTLAHFSKNSAATPGLGRGSHPKGGLTDFGKELIHALNELEILVDVAHVNPAGVMDACALSKAPVIASHTTAMEVHASKRGIPDEGFHAIAETGGVVAVIFGPNFLKGKLDASLDAVVEHTLYIADLIGPEHLALGSDFDGWLPSIPNDIRDCRDLPLLSQKLLDAGMTRDQVSGLLGENFLRVLEAIRPAPAA